MHGGALYYGHKGNLLILLAIFLPKVFTRTAILLLARRKIDLSIISISYRNIAGNIALVFTLAIHFLAASGNILLAIRRTFLFDVSFICKMSVEQQNAAAAAIVLLLLDEEKERKKVKRQRKMWVRKWIESRTEEGYFVKLMVELRNKDETMYKNFLKITPTDFDFLVKKVKPLIQKQSTVMRESISPAERLALSLSFLASGDSYHSLSYLFRIPVCTIGKIIPETCKALYESLKDEWMKVI